MRLILLLPCILLLCTFDSYGQPVNHASSQGDSIQILNISQTRPSEADYSRIIRVDVRYRLASRSKGQLMIGFDIFEVGKFRMRGDLEHIVDPGSGIHTFQATLSEGEWAGDRAISVLVNLSEHPHPKRWFPLASDSQKLNLGP